MNCKLEVREDMETRWCTTHNITEDMYRGQGAGACPLGLVYQLEGDKLIELLESCKNGRDPWDAWRVVRQSCARVHPPFVPEPS